jgi:hypothetical protein
MGEDIQLRGGFYTTDPRLDRIPQHDPRSLRYLSVRKGIQTPIDKSWPVRLYLDQGFDGACVGFGFGHEAIAEPNPNRWVTEKDAKSNYLLAQRDDEWEGGAYIGAEPFYEGTSVLAGAKVYQKKGFFKEYKWTWDIDELILAVGHEGPAVIGVDWKYGMMDTDSSGFIHATGGIAGGHCTLICEVCVSKGYFRIWNSWGVYWGEYGTAKISFDDMALLLEDNGEACIPVNRGYVINPHER